MRVVEKAREFIYGQGANRKANGVPLCHPVEKHLNIVLAADAAAGLLTLGLLLLLQVHGYVTDSINPSFQYRQFVWSEIFRYSSSIMDSLPPILSATTVLSFVAGWKNARADVEARTGN